MPDQTIRCQDCNADFIFTEGEATFYATRNPPLTQPKRCKECRAIKKAKNFTQPRHSPKLPPPDEI